MHRCFQIQTSGCHFYTCFNMLSLLVMVTFLMCISVLCAHVYIVEMLLVTV